MNQITIDDLRAMNNKEGLILMGCGGDPQEWLDGINDTLTELGILQNGSKFQTASVFPHDGHTDMLFDFDGVDLDVGKLAVWRLTTHPMFHGTWLSDFIDNELGGLEEVESQTTDMTIG